MLETIEALPDEYRFLEDEPSFENDEESLPASDLSWPGASSDQLTFMRAVYDRQVSRASAKRSFIADVPQSELTNIEDDKPARTAAALACINLLIAARTDLALQKAAGDAAANRAARVGVSSGYRSASRQFRGWQSAFPKYYNQTTSHRESLSGGPHGAAAVDYLAKYVGQRLAAPGFSMHNNGLAIDFRTRDGGKDLGPNTSSSSIRGWRASWFFGWLAANAGRFNFHENTAIDEPWHWEYRAPAGSEAIESEDLDDVEDVPAGRQEMTGVTLLKGHRGSGPDLILRWNTLPDALQTVDVVVHLHGYSNNGLRMNLARDKEPISGLDFNDPDSPSTAGRTRPTLGVLPRGNFFGGRSGAGFDFPALVTGNGLRDLISLALSQLGSSIGSPSLTMGRLIITCHSGGGAPLMRILRNLDPDEVEVFDGLYGDASSLIRWALSRIKRDAAAMSGKSPDEARSYMSQQGGSLRVLYRPRTGTQAQSLAVNKAIRAGLAAGSAGSVLQDWYRVESTATPHNDIPRRFGWRLLADASSSLPAVAAATEADEPDEDTPGEDDAFEAQAGPKGIGRSGRATIAITGSVQGKFKSESLVKSGDTEIVSFSYEVSSPRDLATGQARGKRQHSPVTITKESGESSPQIFKALVSNEVLSEVVVNFFRQSANGQEQVYQTFKLTNCHISSQKQFTESDTASPSRLRTLENVSIVFQKIEMENKAGKTSAVDTFGAAA